MEVLLCQTFSRRACVNVSPVRAAQRLCAFSLRPGHSRFPAANKASCWCASCDFTHGHRLPGSTVPPAPWSPGGGVSDWAKTSYLTGQ